MHVGDRVDAWRQAVDRVPAVACTIGVAANPTPSINQQTCLDAGPEDYSTTLVGLMIQYGW